MGKAAEKFSFSDPRLSELFHYGADIYHKSDEEICSRLQQGIPTLIPLTVNLDGTDAHAICALAIDKLFILCNRNAAEESLHQIHAFECTLEQFTPELIHTLVYSRFKNQSSIISLLEPLLFSTERTASLTESPFLVQTIGNCTYTSAELAAYPFFKVTTENAYDHFTKHVKNNRSQAIKTYLQTTLSLEYPVDQTFLREVARKSLQLSMYTTSSANTTKVDTALDQLFQTPFDEQFITAYLSLLHIMENDIDVV
jgi:hypothetical protein